ncbi:hypothetical protein [Erythrobacter dokdonensis]|jgi:hypothetical protein|uniref:Uncharacterized protein n=1 Tax=Erythrobacter dokdonensis DSW-74 TaxID=1300349 RepID=A0A1A7BI36_9SPHN|nr:hypothetical protein [Erythrobacter dokdonensis]MEE4316896.1 hypothetical protein [Erythrobacter sp.]OBV10860.1 hypothetical protein I603_2073 [Erythrobacter dokdonensis DSW-74]
MASLPPQPILPRAEAEPADAPALSVLVGQWDALHGQVARLGAMARIAPETDPPAFGTLVEIAHPWQRSLAAQGLDDIAAMLASGLVALATLTARGQDTSAPALALWREFHAARASILAALEVPAQA